MFELDAYLERIGLSGRPGIAEIHRAHVSAIPFENLDPYRGTAVSLDLADLQRKLVARRLLLRAQPAAQGRARGARSGGGSARPSPCR